MLSPWFLLCLMFLTTFSIVLINYNKWEVDINSKFVLYIFTAILAFGCGCALVQFIKKPYAASQNKNSLSIVKAEILQAKYPVNLFLFLSIILTCIYVLKLLIDAGMNASFTAVLRHIYEMQSVGGYSPGFIFNQCREVVVAIAYLNVFRLLIRIYSGKDKLSIIKLILPIFLFLLLIVVSTERNLFLRFAIYSVCVWVFIFAYSHRGKNLNLRIVVRAALILIVIVLLFFLLGVTKQYTSSLFDQISIYCASGLNNFNLWIRDFNEPLLYGKSTFTTFLSTIGVILSPFGIKLSGTVEQIDPFISYITSDGYHYYTNIYSALKPFVEDFGYFGVIIFPFIIGMFYQWLYWKAKQRSYGLSMIIYCMLIYSVIYFPILEQAFRRFHMGFVYELVWISLLYYFVFVKNKSKIIINHKSNISEVQHEKR